MLCSVLDYGSSIYGHVISSRIIILFLIQKVLSV